MEASTHQIIDVKEIKENIAILKNGGLRMVLMVSSINFGLKSQDEQQAIIERFQDLVNSLDYTIQILVQSRQLDISEYLAFLKEQSEKQTNELLKIQAAEYTGFIEELIKLTNVMSKFFYVVVPLTSISINIKSSSDPKKQNIDFESKKNQLLRRVDQIRSLLGAMGLKTIPLGREELVELLYASYNPGSVLKQKNMEELIATGDEAKKVE